MVGWLIRLGRNDEIVEMMRGRVDAPTLHSLVVVIVYVRSFKHTYTASPL